MSMYGIGNTVRRTSARPRPTARRHMSCDRLINYHDLVNRFRWKTSVKIDIEVRVVVPTNGVHDVNELAFH